MVDRTEQDDEIIELTQVVEAELSDGPGQDVIELTDIHTQVEVAAQLEEISLEPVIDDDSAPEPLVAIESSISQEQLEAALERVIEKKIATIIEQNLGEVMEKVVEREIVGIRQRLQASLDEIVS